MKIILLGISIIIFNIKISHCQESTAVLTDSSIVLGKLLGTATIGTDLNKYCMIDDYKFIHDERTVIIKGVRKCKSSSYSNNFDVFAEIIINNKEYLVKQSEVEIYKDDFYTKYDNFSEDEKLKFQEHGKYIGQIYHKSKIDEIIKFTNNCSSKGLCIIEWSIFDESEHTDGTSFKINVLNPTKKTIKYLWFTLVGYNPVGDKVFERTKQSTSITLKAVGPIAPDENGSYNFDYVWFTDLVETAKITQIKIQFMDGSIKLITNTDSIRMSSEMVQTLTNIED